jgi:signal peptidase II
VAIADPLAAPAPRGLAGPLGLGAVVVAVDQLTKHLALAALREGRTIEVVGSLQFKLFFNTGSAFSIGAGRGGLIGVLAIGIVVALLRSARSMPGRLATVALGLVLGGAVGNLVDRGFRRGDGFLGGAVVDFVDLQWWPVFNVADVAVVAGAALLVVASIRADRATATARARRGDARGGVDTARVDVDRPAP